MLLKDRDLVISYSHGYGNWYVSSFYKYFHIKLQEQYGIELEFIPIEELGKQNGVEHPNMHQNLFNWYNLLIYNKKTDKYFVHSWHDYAPEIFSSAIRKGYNIVKFSCVSNLTADLISQHPDQLIPTVYCFEFWDDYNNITQIRKQTNKIEKIYFNGLKHSIRENFYNALSKNEFFKMLDRNVPAERRKKLDYYNDLQQHKFCLSLKGAADICYRDLEIFGVGSLNVRVPLYCNTGDPLIKDVHYIEFFDNVLVDRIIHNQDVEVLLAEKIDMLQDFGNSPRYTEMVDSSLDWFENNCNPEKQFLIISNILQDFTILD